MTVTELKKLVNTNLAGDQLSWKMLCVHLNWAIDEVNAELNACFPVATADMTEYTAIPDKYIRMVLVPGAVHHYYVVDDEGSTGEQDFAQQFNTGMFRMLRDYSHCIPEIYQDDADNGTVESTYEDNLGMRGVTGDITTVGWW